MKKSKLDSKSKEEKLKELEQLEFDLTELKGILPEDIELTQNIGCVGKKSKNDQTK